MAEVGSWLYKRDNTGGIRTWRMEINGDCYRSVSGVLDGEEVYSGWKQARPKNIGRSNGTSAEEQALAEVASKYQKKRDSGYFESLEEIDEGTFFHPMLAKKYDGWAGPCFSQPKHDGIRCIAMNSGLWSRRGKELLGAPHIMEALRPAFDKNPNLIFDGELYNHRLHDDFNSIVSCVKKQQPTFEDLLTSRQFIEYHIYDLPSNNGRFADRYNQMTDIICGISEFIVPVETFYCDSEEALNTEYELLLERDYEGQIIRFNNLYENKRSKFLMKRKEFIDQEFPVVMIEEGAGNWAGYAKSVMCRLPDGRTFSAGLKGDQAFAAQLLIDADKYVGKLATVRYLNLTPAGKPRMGVVHQLGREE